MSRLLELEAMVRDAWNRGTQVAFGNKDDSAARGAAREELRGLLAVYADELQQLGDPRGELIAFDLLRTPSTDDRQRFATLLDRWLGPLATHPNVNTKYGLLGLAISNADPSILHELLATRGAPFVSSVTIFGDAQLVQRAIEQLADQTRPWLTSLRIVVPSSPLDASFDAPIIAPDLAAGLVEATPALYTLALGGEWILRDFEHPTLQRLVVDGHEALGTIAGHGPPLPAVTDLDFAFLRVRDLARLLAPARLPAVRRLDLSRNTSDSIYRFLRSLPLVRQLTHLRLPMLRTREERDLLQATLDEMTHLAELELEAVAIRGPYDLRHPRATFIIPPSMPWPARDQLSHLEVRIALPDDNEHVADVAELVPVMERSYLQLPIDARVTWDDWWNAIAELDTDDRPFELPVASLADAMAACADALPNVGWRDIATALADLQRANQNGSVRVSRF